MVKTANRRSQVEAWGERQSSPLSLHQKDLTIKTYSIYFFSARNLAQASCDLPTSNNNLSASTFSGGTNSPAKTAAALQPAAASPTKSAAASPAPGAPDPAA
jgi:hypothetical protein